MGYFKSSVVCKPIFMSIPTQLRKVEVVLRLSLGCDKKNCGRNNEIMNMYNMLILSIVVGLFVLFYMPII